MNYVSQENLDNIVKGLSKKIAMSVSNGALIGDTTPVGTVISFMGTQAPLFYLICDGTTYNIAEYQELADFIEAQFGAVNYFGGDGITTFAVPDLQGEFLRGSGTNSHTDMGDGANVGVHQDATTVPDFVVDAIGAQRIYFPVPTISTSNADSITLKPIPTDTTNNVSGRKFVNPDGSDTHTGSSGGNLKTIRPTNTSVLYCIKYTKAVIPSEYEDGTPIGRVIFDSILREGYIKANGAQIEDASISIPRLLSFVQKYSSQLIAYDQATYEANVGLYMYDSNNDILTLPNYIGRFVEGGNSVESIEAGLPNIKGGQSQKNASAYYTEYGPSQGAFYFPSTWAGHERAIVENSAWTLSSITFDASRYSSIYSDSVTTVQPSSITLIPQIRY